MLKRLLKDVVASRADVDRGFSQDSVAGPVSAPCRADSRTKELVTGFNTYSKKRRGHSYSTPESERG